MSGTYRIKNMGTKKFVEVGKGSSQCLQIDDDQTVDAFCYARADKDKVSKQNSQLWYIQGRFTSKVNYVKIFEADNSKGTQDFEIVEDISQGIT